MCECNEERIGEIESGLILLGLKKCDMCSGWKKEKDVKFLTLKHKMGTFEGNTFQTNICKLCIYDKVKHFWEFEVVK
jgi:hypothetical protein